MSRVSGCTWAIGAVSTLVVASVARRRGTANTQRCFHVAGSWDWNSWQSTHYGTDYNDAIYNKRNPKSLAAQIESLGEESSEYLHSEKYRIYAVIEGGKLVENDVPQPRRSLRGRRTPRLDGLELDTPVFFVWQAEDDIGVQAMTPREAGSFALYEIEQAAWRKIDGSNYFLYDGCINDPNYVGGNFGPDMIVIGGKLIEQGVLS